MRLNLPLNAILGIDVDIHDLGLALELELQTPSKRYKGWGFGTSIRILPVNIWVQRWQA